MFRTDPRLFGTEREPLWSLLYRYWFWGWIFRDVNDGDVLRRASSWRHNVAMRTCLRVYMGRWLACTAATGLVAQRVEASTGASVLPAIFYSCCVMGVIVFSIALTLSMFLARQGSE
ncbi:MAG: hypothetical protein M3Z31_10450 [Pseudomonadota bacterium]|nr:hypothetical protein [Pseudomonadota bacterium]